MRTEEVPVLADVEMETGDMPVHEMEVGVSHFEDYPGDDFEKVGEFTPEKTPQTPAKPVLSVPSEETPSSAEPRRKRINTLVGGWIYHGSESSQPNGPKPLHPQTNLPTDSFPNQPANLIVWLLKGL